jgi:5'-3' exonuclease
MNTILVDTSFLAHQARNSLGQLASDNDNPSGVIFNILVRIVTIGTRFRTNRFIFCFDDRESIRKQILPTYKGNRQALKEKDRISIAQMHEQVDKLEAWLPLLGFPAARCPGLESDDIIAQICRQCIAQPDVFPHVIIISVDGDLYQCLRAADPDIVMCDPSTTPAAPSRIFDTSALQMKYGVSPNVWAKVKALAGCATDNIKGVPRVGIPTACKYFRGVLPKNHKTFAAIESEEGARIFNFNQQLVTLPFASTPHIELALDGDGGDKYNNLLALAEEYNIRSIFEGELGERWQWLCQGDWEALHRHSSLPQGRVLGRARTSKVSDNAEQTEGLGF